MPLLNDFMEKCVTLVKKSVDNGMGDTVDTWVEGLQFVGSFDYKSSMEARVAEKQGVTGLWDVYLPKTVELEYHNVFKRLSDGQIFRITSKDDKKTPASAGLDLRLVSAEEWQLT